MESSNTDLRLVSFTQKPMNHNKNIHTKTRSKSHSFRIYCKKNAQIGIVWLFERFEQQKQHK